MNLATIATDVARRLGDLDGIIWPRADVLQWVQDAYSALATAQPVFWDTLYLENLPRGFSYTQPWERALLVAFSGFDYGCANFTAEFERRLLNDERQRYGPANHTSPFEATDGFLSAAGASTAIPATAELPATLTAIDRAIWDRRGIDALQARSMSQLDSRYEITAGEVYGYIWQKDGIRTLRKVRVPAAQADTVTVNGKWGLLRRCTDLSAVAVTGSWGVPRRIPGQHPIGPWAFGIPRRPYLEGKNVRVEHFRLGREMAVEADDCELPDRYAHYLRDFAQAGLLSRPGPGQDLALAQHYSSRWARGLARVARRIQRVDTERVMVLGGSGQRRGSRPPRPSLPWQYGRTVTR